MKEESREVWGAVEVKREGVALHDGETEPMDGGTPEESVAEAVVIWAIAEWAGEESHGGDGLVNSVGEGEGVKRDGQLVVADGGWELRGELGKVGVDVVGEVVVEGNTSGEKVMLVPTFKLRSDISLNVSGDRRGMKEAVVEVSSGCVRGWRVRGE